MKTTEVSGLSALIRQVQAVFPVSPRGHLFRTDKNYYFYDTNTREIIRCDVISVEIIKHLGQSDFESRVWPLVKEHGNDTVADSLKQLITLSKDRYPPLFSTKDPKEFRYPLDFKYFKHKIDHELEALILGVTDRCNMACRYCAYSGKLEGRPPHSNHVMSQEVLQNSLNYFIEHSDCLTGQDVSIGFYGGEPTLCLELIRYTVDYLNKSFNGRKYVVNMTTNFLSISTELMTFLRDNNISINVSLDGPKDVHDRYRVRPDGTGTFVQVMKNLRRLKEFDEDYYKKNVKFLPTMTPPYKIEQIQEFFVNEELVDTDEYLIVGWVDSPEVVLENCVYESRDNECFSQMRKEYHERCCQGTLNDLTRHNRFLKVFFDRTYLNFYRRPIINRPLGDVEFAGGICQPGQRKLFVRWDGTYFPCERVPEYDSLVIGNHRTGVDAEKAYKLCVDFGEMCAEDCKKCWAITLCHSCCFRGSFDKDGPAPDKKRKACKKAIKDNSTRLSEMCSVLEKNPEAFKHLDEYIVH